MSPLLPLGLVPLCCVFEALFLRSRDRGNHRAALALKSLASLCFVALGLLSARSVPGSLPVVLGLVFGMLGDQLLALRKLFPAHHDLTFITGALSFSLGHFCYMAYLTETAEGMLLPAIPVFLVLAAGSELFARYSGFSQGRMHLPGLLYIAIEAAMCALALVRLWLAPGLSAVLFAAGGLLFLVSDNLLCAYSFGKMKTRAADRWLHITYIAAQLLIARSPAL